jgi:hypothetical protein
MEKLCDPWQSKWCDEIGDASDERVNGKVRCVAYEENIQI